MQNPRPAPRPLRTLTAEIRQGKSSARAMLEVARQRSEEAASLNAIAHVDWEAAQRQALALDRQAADSPASCGPLHGLPIAIKDLFSVEGMPMRAGTRAALPSVGEGDAELVQRLRRAGALIFAKTNMHELALGATGENAWTGDVCNPHDPLRQAGGSSSGAAVAVATGIGVAGVGSDTGGSVRIPAAFCGVTGFKPSYQAISLRGGLHLSFTCDHAGPLAPTVDDCALLYEVMSGRRSDHGAVARRPRLALPLRWLEPRMDDAVAEVFGQAISHLQAAGAEIESIDLPALGLAWEHYTPLVRAEAAWIHRQALEAQDPGFSELVLPPLTAGRSIDAATYLDALRAREQVREQFAAVLSRFDAIALPTSPVLPPLRGQTEVMVAKGQRLSTREAVLGQTLAFSFAGVPAIAMPMGMARGLPVSLHLASALDADASLLALARWAETALAAR